MINEVTARCSHCQKELPLEHKGACPYCGKTGKNVIAIANVTIGIKETSAAIHKPKWSGEALTIFWSLLAILVGAYIVIIAILPVGIIIKSIIILVSLMFIGRFVWWQRYNILMFIRKLEANFGGKKEFK